MKRGEGRKEGERGIRDGEEEREVEKEKEEMVEIWERDSGER